MLPRSARSAPPPRWRRALALVAVLGLLGGCAPAGDDASAPGPVTPSPEERAAPESALPRIDDAPPPEPEPPPPRTSSPPSAAEPDDPPAVDRSALQAALQRLLATARDELSDAELTVHAVDPEGRGLLSHRPDRPLLPASTLKLVTAAAILVTLGPDARLTTTVETTGAVDGDGVVRGDLQLVGGGDPLLATPEYGRWIYPARPRTPLEALADELVAVGVKRVAGDVLGAAPGFTGPREAAGWHADYFHDFDARRITGLTVDAGLRTELRRPSPPAADREEGAPVADEGLDEEAIGPDDVRLHQADDPVAQTAGELVRLLEERGVEVDGRARAGEAERPVRGTLARVDSPPLHEILRFMVQRSDNHIADTLFHVAGRVRTGQGSWQSGERALRQVLGHLGVDPDGLRFADGSGLSREDRLTARSLVELDRAMTASRHAGVWESLLAVAGEPGTLHLRLRATPAQGRLLAKTGSLRDVLSLAGVVRGDGGERYHFALVANDATGADRAVVRAFADELALLLSADLLSCRTDVADGDDGPLGRPPLVVAC